MAHTFNPADTVVKHRNCGACLKPSTREEYKAGWYGNLLASFQCEDFIEVRPL